MCRRTTYSVKLLQKAQRPCIKQGNEGQRRSRCESTGAYRHDKVYMINSVQDEVLVDALDYPELQFAPLLQLLPDCGEHIPSKIKELTYYSQQYFHYDENSTQRVKKSNQVEVVPVNKVKVNRA